MWEVQIGKGRTIKSPCEIFFQSSIGIYFLYPASSHFFFFPLFLFFFYIKSFGHFAYRTKSGHDLVGDQGYHQKRKDLNPKLMTPGEPLV